MEEKKLNFVSNGVSKLPRGFRFEPTDEEIVFQYLKCKVFGLPLPADVIPEINVYQYDPWDLPGEVGKDEYFFCNKKMSAMSSRSNNKAKTCSGYWKSTGEEQLILSSTSADKQLTGLRKTMVFYKGNVMSSVGNKDALVVTEWNKHEYQLTMTCSSSAHCKFPKKKCLTLSLKGGWSICHILKIKPAVISYASMNLNKRIREYTDIDLSSDEFKLSKLADNGAKTCSTWSSSSPSSSFCSWSSKSSISEISSEEISSSRSC